MSDTANHETHPREAVLRAILAEQPVAGLGTLHQGRPAVSMVPFALVPGAGLLVIHVSRLASHTRDLETTQEVGLLVLAERRPGVTPQALARVSIAGRARFCPPQDPLHAAARAAYLQRFPESEPLFDFSDFALVLVEPQSVRVIGGFAQAWSLSGDQYRRAMASDASAPMT